MFRYEQSRTIDAEEMPFRRGVVGVIEDRSVQVRVCAAVTLVSAFNEALTKPRSPLAHLRTVSHCYGFAWLFLLIPSTSHRGCSAAVCIQCMVNITALSSYLLVPNHTMPMNQ